MPRRTVSHLWGTNHQDATSARRQRKARAPIMPLVTIASALERELGEGATAAELSEAEAQEALAAERTLPSLPKKFFRI